MAVDASKLRGRFGTPPADALPQVVDAPSDEEPVPMREPVILPPKARKRGEPRSPMTVRITDGVQDRLWRSANALGKSQQEITEEALEAYLKKKGF
jgi:hypothetical protein